MSLSAAGDLAWALSTLGVADPWALMLDCARFDPTGWQSRVRCQVLARCYREADRLTEPAAVDWLDAALRALERTERERDAVVAELELRHADEERRIGVAPLRPTGGL